MSNQLNLSELSTQQIISLLWQLKGTPQAQPLYDELANRPPKERFSLNDPDWEAKFAESLSQTVTAKTEVNR